MLNFWNSVLGIFLIIGGVLILVNIIRSRENGSRDEYGNDIQIFFSSVGLLLCGIYLLIKELLKL